MFCVLGLQIWLVVSDSLATCGKMRWQDLLKNVGIFGVAYWILIFGLTALILQMSPGWKQPFSNFFGYLVVMLMGVKETFNELLKSPSKTSDVKLNAVIEISVAGHSARALDQDLQRFEDSPAQELQQRQHHDGCKDGGNPGQNDPEAVPPAHFVDNLTHSFLQMERQLHSQGVRFGQ